MLMRLKTSEINLLQNRKIAAKFLFCARIDVS